MDAYDAVWLIDFALSGYKPFFYGPREVRVNASLPLHHDTRGSLRPFLLCGGSGPNGIEGDEFILSFAHSSEI